MCSGQTCFSPPTKKNGRSRHGKMVPCFNAFAGSYGVSQGCMGTVAIANWTPGPGAGSSLPHPHLDAGTFDSQLHKFMNNTPFC